MALNQDQYLFNQQLTGIFNSIEMLYQNALNQANNAPDSFTKNMWLAKSQAYQDCINITNSVILQQPYP